MDPARASKTLGWSSALCIITTSTYAGIYWGMWAQAMSANDTAMEHGYGTNKLANGYQEPTQWFDTCGTGWDAFDTKMSVFIGFNAIWNTLMTIFSILLIMGGMNKMANMLGSMGHAIGVWVTFALLITGAAILYTYEMNECARSMERIDLSRDMTYSDAVCKLRNLWISQLVVYCFYGCWVGALTRSSKVMLDNRN